MSGDPQGSLLGVILFNIHFNDIFDINDEAELCNYADDNNLSAVGDSTIEAKNILKQQTTVLLERFDQNHLIAILGKFHLMFLSTDKTDQMVNEQLSIGDKTLNSEPSITLLGMDIDNLLTFNKHIANLCKNAASNSMFWSDFQDLWATLRENLSCKRLFSRILIIVHWYGIFAVNQILLKLKKYKREH